MSDHTTNPRSNRNPISRRERLKGIANSTLDALKAGSYEHNGITHDIAKAIQESENGTKFYSHTTSDLGSWSTTTPARSRDTDVSIVELSTMAATRQLSLAHAGGPKKRIGLLNFASATKPGGGFLTGANAQEESIARSSTLYPALITPEAQQFYHIHLKHKGLKSEERRSGSIEEEGMVKNEAFYTHSMIYTPSVLLLKDDDGNWTEPCLVDVLTSAAPNAGVIRQENRNSVSPTPEDELEAKIEDVMRERMGRILLLFEQNSVDTVILGSFGTGVFKNKVDVVARLWAELLGLGRSKEGCGRFKGSFEKAVFAIIDNPTYEVFKKAFWGDEEKE